MRLTIVSSYDEVCGNATYAEALRRLLAPDFDEVTVTGLNTFLLENRSPALARSKDDHVEELCAKIREYDHVNFQVELGLYGSRPRSALAVLRRLLAASKHASLTMHRIDLPMDARGWFAQLVTKPHKLLFDALKRYRHNQWADVYLQLLKLARSRNFPIIVHTKREAELIGYLAPGLKVLVHPICFSTPDDMAAVRSRSLQLSASLKRRLRLDDDSVLLGIFGFVSSYKMVHTAVEALRHLPACYKLVIVGGVHPHAIQPNEFLNPYIRQIWTTVHGSLGDEKIAQGTSQDDNVTNRVFFIGHASDPELNELIAACDFSLLPYMETGQSGSGVAALSMEYAQRMVCSKNLAFLELARFAPGAFAMADIGFAKGLADAIVAFRSALHVAAQAAYQEKYNGITNAAVYRAAANRDWIG